MPFMCFKIGRSLLRAGFATQVIYPCGEAQAPQQGQRDLSYMGFYGGERVMPWINGKFYVSNGLPRRMLPDGNIDPSFGPISIGPYFQYSTTGDYHVFSDGRALISGSHMLSDSIRGFEGNYELIWFTSTGYLDTTRTHRNQRTHLELQGTARWQVHLQLHVQPVQASRK